MEHFLKKLFVVTTKEHTVTTLQVFVNSYLQHQYHMITNTVITIILYWYIKPLHSSYRQAIS